MKKQVASIIMILLFLIGIFSGCVEDSPKIIPNIIFVNPDGSADYISIQDAINVSNDNGIIYVSNGTFYEFLTIEKPINLIGEGIERTFLSGIYVTEGIESLILIQSKNCSIEGFTLIESSNSQLDGIKAINSFNISILNNSIIGFNHGIYFTTSSDYNFILNNFVKNNLYGIRIQLSEYNNITRNTLTNNSRGVFCCCSAKYNEIHFNNFYENRDYNGYETNNLVNYWDNNYWDDYIGVDDNNDGFGDTSYNIPRNNNNDSKPLMNPFE
jgi:parallel beta-helix repeat protein